MAVYTVHEPPRRTGDPLADADRVRFVRDGFHGWAFLLAPLWMLRHRLWLALLLYVLAVAALHGGLWVIDAPATAQAAVAFLVALLIGFEAATLRRWTLARRGWNNLGVVVGDDRETAERRFFAAWRGAPPPPAPPPSPAYRQESGVIGLFPQPGAAR
jgi:hypothetical protein